jgi:DNA-binding XRE family transcriptional regulator
VRPTTKARAATNIDKVVGNNLKDAREAAFKAATDCAALINISQDEYDAIEAGQMRCRAENLVTLAAYFKVPVADFFKSVKVHK